MENAPPISFLIDDFLQRGGITGLAAPATARKSLMAINCANALITGDPLFDHFEVTRKPERVIYLCPEVSIGPFADRLRKMDMINYVGTKLLVRTLSSEGTLELADERLKEFLPGSVVVLDTATRFLKGDENSSEHVRMFADQLFALIRNGAEAVLMLHHSAKGSDKSEDMTLESVMRGSGDMGAMLTACWGTRMRNPEEPFASPSYLENVKQRDFRSVAFDVTSGDDGRLHWVDSKGKAVKVPRSSDGDKDGKQAAADAAIRDRPDLSLRKLVEHLASLGIERGITWVAAARKRIKEEQYAEMQANGGKFPSRQIKASKAGIPSRRKGPGPVRRKR